MRRRYLSLLRAGCLVAALAVAADLPAIETQDSVAQLRKFVDEARDQLAAMRSQVDQVDAQVAHAARLPESTNDTRVRSVFGAAGSYEYSDLKRSATRLADIGNHVVRLTSRCGEESRSVGRDFRTHTRRLQSSVNRIGSAGSPGFARMSVEKVRHEIDAVGRQLQIVGQMTLCERPDSAEDSDSTANSD